MDNYELMVQSIMGSILRVLEDKNEYIKLEIEVNDMNLIIEISKEELEIT